MQSVLIALLLTTLVHSTLLGLVALLAARQTPDPTRRSWILRAAIVAPLMTAGLQVAAGGWLGWESWHVTSGDAALADVPAATGTPTALMVLPGPITPLRAGPSNPAPPAPKQGGSDSGTTWGTWLLGLWLAGAAIGALDLVHRRRRFVAALDRSSFRDADARERLHSLTNTRGVRLSASRTLTVPLAVSAREICVPRSRWDELTGDAKDALLAHEVAHVDRRDPAWFLVEQLIERVLFVQPLVRILRRASRRAAELACDERAARATQRPIELARCLATVAGWSQRDAAPTSMASMAHADAPVVDRVERLLALDGQSNTTRGQRQFGVTLGAGLLAFACAAPNVAVMVESPDGSHARDLPLGSETLLVAIERTGEARLLKDSGSRTLGTFDLDQDQDRKAFQQALATAAAEFPRGGPGALSDQLADGVVRIRTTPDTEFYYAQLVMQACGTREVMLWNIELETTGTPDAIFQYRLPTDVGVSAGPPPLRLSIAVRVGSKDPRTLEARYEVSRHHLIEEEMEIDESKAVSTVDRERAKLEERVSAFLDEAKWRPIADLQRMLDDPNRPFEIEKARLDVRHEVTGLEASRLVDWVIDAGATDIVFVGAYPR